MGVIPFEDVLCLMKYSVGIINPSLSEGWSNTVDQANCYGRKILLSDIKVHKEQKPFRGVYFKKHNHKDLASKLIKVSSLKIKQKAEKMHILKAYNDSKLKRKKYAENYQNFIIKMSH